MFVTSNKPILIFNMMNLIILCIMANDLTNYHLQFRPTSILNMNNSIFDNFNKFESQSFLTVKFGSLSEQNFQWPKFSSTYPSFLCCLWASAQVTSPACLIQSLRSLERDKNTQYQINHLNSKAKYTHHVPISCIKEI